MTNQPVSASHHRTIAKRSWAAFLGSVLLSIPISATAQLTWVTNGQTVTITRCGVADVDITIPATTNGHRVTGIGDFAFANASQLVRVTIPASVTNIGAEVFIGCPSLMAINVDSANPVYSSLNGILFDASKSTLIWYPGGLPGNYAIPGGVTVIAPMAFTDCTGLTNVTIPPSVVSIGDRAFAYTKLTGVTLPAGLTNIGAGAFVSCTSLTNIALPANVAGIGDDAFTGCLSLETLTVDAANRSFLSVGGALFDVSRTRLILYPGSLPGSYAIPSGVTWIANGAFSDCAGLTNVTIPSTVVSIGDSAFANTGLVDLVIPGSVTNIGGSAFYSCASLTNVTIPESVVSLGGSAFGSCVSLVSITVPGTVASLGDSLFANCVRLSDVTLGSGITEINDFVFYGCTSLTDIKIPQGVTNVGNSVFFGCASLADITIPGSVASVGPSMFYDCFQLTHATIGNGVSSIGDDAFYGCTKLAGVTIPDSVTNIGVAAFSHCTKLAAVTMPSSITLIRDQTFAFCTTLASVTIPSNVGIIGNSAFAQCTNLTSVTIPNSVTSIESQAFYSCTNLPAVTIPASVTNVGGQAFWNCANLTAINVDPLNGYYSSIGGTLFNKSQTKLLVCPGGKAGTYMIPPSTVSIETNSFQGCSRLTNVVLLSGVTNIGDHAFYVCSRLASVTVLGNVAKIWNGAFGACPLLKKIYFQGDAPATAGLPFAASSPTVYYSVWAKGWGAKFGLVVTTNWITSFKFDSVDNATFTAARIPLDTNTSLSVPAALNGVPVTGIATQAFDSATNLMTVSIPGSVTDIGDRAFSNCSSLTNIAVDVANPNFSGANGILFNKFKTVLIQCPGGKAGLVAIPGSVTLLDDNAFAGCRGLIGVFFAADAPTVGGADLFDGANLTTVYYKRGTAGWASTFVGRPTALWPDLTVQRQVNNLILTWPQGILEETADLVNGPWVTNPAASPYTVASGGLLKFYRIRLQ